MCVLVDLVVFSGIVVLRVHYYGIVLFAYFCLMIRRPPRSTRTDTLFPYTTLFRSELDFLLFQDFQQFRKRPLNHVQCEPAIGQRSEEHTSELQSLMRISYAVFCLKKKTHQEPTINETQHQQILKSSTHITTRTYKH